MISTIIEYVTGKIDKDRTQWFNGVHLNKKSTNPALSKQINNYDKEVNTVANKIQKNSAKKMSLQEQTTFNAICLMHCVPVK